MHLVPVIKQRVPKHHSLGQEEREPGAFLKQGKQPQLAPQLPVVALLGLLNAVYVFVQIGLLFKRRAVNTLQHLVLLAAAPVRARNAHQLYEPYLARCFNVRAGAQVNEVPLLIEAYYRVLGQVLYKLNLIGLFLLLEVFYRLRAGHFKPLQRKRFRNYLLHLLLNLFKIFRGKGFRVKVIIEAVLYCGAYCKLGFRMHALHGLRQYMGRGVAHCPAAVLILPGEQLERMVAVYGAEGIRALAVYFGGKGSLFKLLAYCFGYLKGCHAVFKLLYGSVWECDVHNILLMK